jgi:tRNA1Val (adenine37-N6)-methyltransferase
LIDAIEIDKQAASQAAENIAASAWSNRINVIPQDLLHWIPGKQLDVIFSNPPFYQNDLKSSNGAKNKAHHDEGLLLPQLLQFVQTHLTIDGSFFLLLPAKREKESEMLLHKVGLILQQKVMVQQTLNHSPFRMMIQGGRKKCESKATQSISIKDEKDEYTPAFTALLKDYYLHL